VRVPFQRTIAVLLVPVLFSGCYTYVPVEPGAVLPGAEVRARVAAPAAAILADTLGLTNTRLLDGTLVDQHADGITLSVQTAPPGTIGAPKGIFKNVAIKKPDLLELESAKIDKFRSGVAVAVVVGGIIAGAVLLHGQGSGGGTPSEPPPNVTRGLLFHFHF
jgi:hypothetical protein